MNDIISKSGQPICRREYTRSAALESADLWPLLDRGVADDVDPRVEISLLNRTLSIEGERYEVILEVTLVGVWNGRRAYRAFLSRAGIFDIGYQASAEDRKRVLNVDCSELLFPGVCSTAVDLIRGAGFRAPRIPEVSFGLLYAKMGRQRAEDASVTTLREFWAAHTRLGRVTDLGLATALGRPVCSVALSVLDAARRAVPAADALLGTLPPESWILEAMGAVYVMNNLYGRAVNVYRQASPRWPGNARWHYNLGTCLMFVGKLNEAAHEIQQCLSCDATFWDGYAVQTKLRGYGNIPRSRTNALERTLAQHVDDRLARQRLHMAIAVDYEEMGDYASAFNHFAQGNRARREAIPYVARDDAEMFDALRCYAPVARDRWSGSGDTPIFVVGMPRSGTTLVDRILSCHNDVQSAGELKHFGMLLKEMCGSLTPHLLDSDTIMRSRELDWHMLGQRYINCARPIAFHGKYFIDKLPHNFLYVPYIRAAIPGARVIWVRRGALDTCLANFREEFASDSAMHSYASDLQDIGVYYVMYERLMQHWQSLFQDYMLEVSYERLVSDTRVVTEEMLKFCGMEWDDACEHFEANASPTATASAVQVRRAIYHESVGRWRHYAGELASLKTLLCDAGIATTTDALQ